MRRYTSTDASTTGLTHSEKSPEPARDRQEPAVDAAQDGLHARVGRRRDVQHVEVPEEARRHLLPPAAGWRARTTSVVSSTSFQKSFLRS